MSCSRCLVLSLLTGCLAQLGWACSSDHKNGGAPAPTATRPPNTGAMCTVPGDCYPGIQPTAIKGQVECIDTQGGYCTHQCTAEADCCAAPGECAAGLAEVCSPFESSGQNLCFVSCDASVLGGLDEATYCQQNASPDFICRSSGGGSGNRKICMPGTCGVGAACTADTQCAAGLVCLTTLNGGYCGVAGCTTNASCPTGSLCL